MYYYISFLRPPPYQIYPSSKTVPVTLQIANDLRTELYTGDIDLFLSWIPWSRPGSDSVGQATKLSKLTTWKQSTAYKEIPAPMPPAAREGQSWRMVITAQAGVPGSHCIPLNDRTCGSIPFPVFSMPILFSAKGKKENFSEKQDCIMRHLSVSSGDASNVSPAILIKEQTSFDLDKKLWDSGIGLSHWMLDLCNPTKPGGSPHISKILNIRKLFLREQLLTVVELGAGTGIVSNVLANIRNRLAESAYANSDADPNFTLESDNIITTDLESAMPLLSENIGNARTDVRSQPNPLVLDWEETKLPEPVVLARQAGIDLILMADVTYNTQVFPALVQTLSKLLANDVHETTILLGYKERDPDERTLWSMLAAVGIDLEQIGSVPGSGGQPVEIWIATVH